MHNIAEGFDGGSNPEFIKSLRYSNTCGMPATPRSGLQQPDGLSLACRFLGTAIVELVFPVDTRVQPL